MQECVQPRDADRVRIPRIDPHERVLARGELELIAKLWIPWVRVAEAVEHRGDRGDRAGQPPQLSGRDEVGHDHERDRPLAVDEALVDEPLLDLRLHERTATPELRELDQILELQVADVIDHSPLRA